MNRSKRLLGTDPGPPERGCSLIQLPLVHLTIRCFLPLDVLAHRLLGIGARDALEGYSSHCTTSSFGQIGPQFARPAQVDVADLFRPLVGVPQNEAVHPISRAAWAG